jgi:hypothetical protein
MLVPKELWALFVPIAKAGGNPAQSSMGSEISPPPPAIESMKLADIAARKRASRIENEKSMNQTAVTD